MSITPQTGFPPPARCRLSIFGAALLASSAASAPAQEPQQKPGWSAEAELSYVRTSGNARARTFGFGATAKRNWGAARLGFEAGAVRSDSTVTTRFAVGISPQDFTVIEESDSETTAENYFARARYERDVHERLFWYAGVAWERNTFAGIERRISGFGGIGNIWIQTETTKLRTDYGLSFTSQHDVVGTEDDSDRFAGLRLGAELERKLTRNTSYSSVLIAEQNLSDGSDFRADWSHALKVAMSDRLALKLNLRLLYDRQPALEELPLFAPALPPDPAPPVGTVLVELERLDTFFTLALVISF